MIIIKSIAIERNLVNSHNINIQNLYRGESLACERVKSVFVTQVQRVLRE